MCVLYVLALTVGCTGNGRETDGSSETDTVEVCIDERCNGVDDDCDGEVDEEPIDALTGWVDADGDTWGDDAQPVSGCTLPEGAASAGGDCDDADAGVHPEATETCDAIDDDCDTRIDDADDDVQAPTWYVDADQDGTGDANDPGTVACIGPIGASSAGGDCDDADPDRHPGAQERCDDVDDDCDPNHGDEGVITRNGDRSYTSLADALSAARDGDDIVVCDGTYTEVAHLGRSVTLRSKNGSASTVIDGSAATTAILTLFNSADVVIEGLTFRGGTGATIGGSGPTSGGALQLADSGPVEIRDCVFEQNTADQGGAILVWWDDPVTILNSTFTDNSATNYGGAIYSLGGDVILTDSTFSANEATYGGALYTDSAAVTATNTVFDANVANSVGGAIYASDAEFTAVSITGNTAQNGAGVCIRDPAEVVADAATVISGNTGYWGGGVMFLSDTYDIDWTGGTIDGNTAGWGGGVYISSQGTGTTTFSGASLDGNAAIGLNGQPGRGGGVYVGDTGNAELADLVITNNVVHAATGDGSGGGIQFESIDVAMTNVTVDGNEADRAAGLDLASAHVDVINSSIVANAAIDYGGGARLDEASVLTSTDSGWGNTGTPRDNTPDDVIFDLATGTTGARTDLETHETFECDGATATCD